MPDTALPLATHWPALNLAGAPRRVVSLVPSVTESLCELGCAERLCAVTDYCLHPADVVRHLPRVGGTKNPDLTRIRAVAPDLIIANQEENRPEDLAALAAEGLKVWVTFPRTVRGALDLLLEFIQLFDVPGQVQQLSQLEKACEWAELAAASEPPVRVFCPIWREPAAAQGAPEWWMTVNQDTYLHDVLRLLGGQNVFAARQRRYPLAADLGQARAEAAPGRDVRYPRVTPAEVAAAAPEVILLPSEPYPFGPEDLAAFDAYPDLPAVRQGRMHVVDGSLLTWHGTRLARAVASEIPGLLAAARPAADDA